MSAVRWEDVAAARERIRGITHQTPVLTSSTIDELTEGSLFFKCESFQRTGSFKLRGAGNAVARLSESERAGGVCAPSSGNFAQALAFAARRAGMPAHIVMPENSNPVKVTATRGYGATVHFCAPSNEARETAVSEIRDRFGATLVHSHDDLDVIAGQGTAVCELIDEVGDLDIILAPVGGGGLISGTLVATKHLLPGAQVIGCEPAGADDAARGIQQGRRIVDFVPNTVADGLRTPLGVNTFCIMRELIDDIVVVPETRILPAMRFLWERMKIIVEPSSAVAIAPLLDGQIDARGKRVGVILSGGNADLSGLFPS